MATGYWHGATNSTWDLTTNWWTTIGGTTAASPVPGAGDTAFFNANGTTTTRNVFLNAPGGRSIGGIVCNSNANNILLYGGTLATSATQTLTIGSGGIDMTGSVGYFYPASTVSIVLGANQTWTVPTGKLLQIDGAVSGTGTLLKTGAGDCYLINATATKSNNSGAVTVNQGNLWLAADNSGTPDQLASVSSITLNNALSPAGQLIFNGAISPATVTSTISGGGTLVVANTAGVTFSGDLTGYTQALYLYMTNASGTTTKATASSVNAIPKAGIVYQTFPRTTTGATATWEYTGSSNYTSSASPAFSIIMTTGTAGQTFVLSNASASGAALSLNGTYQTTTTFATTFQINVAGTSGGMTLSGDFLQPSGVLALTKTGTGALALTGASALTGTVSVSAGTLNANSATALGAASSTAGISVSNGATLSLGGSSAGLTYSSRNLTLFGGLTTNLVVANAFTNTFQSITSSTAATLFRGTSSGTLSGAIACGSFAPTFSASAGNSLTIASAVTASVGMTIGVSGDTGTVKLSASNTIGNTSIAFGTAQAGNTNAFGSTGTVTLSASTTLQTLTTGGQNGKLTVAALNNAAGGTIKIGG